VTEGVVAGQYSDPGVLGDPRYELHSETTDEQLEELKKQYNKELPDTQQAVKGRGKHKGKLVVRNKRVSKKDMVKYATDQAANAMSKMVRGDNIELSSLSDAQISDMLEKLVMTEMVRSKPVPIPKKKSKSTPTRRNSRRTDEPVYECETVKEEEEEEDLWSNTGNMWKELEAGDFDEDEDEDEGDY